MKDAAALQLPHGATNSSWRRVALAMTAAGWGANQFVPMLFVYRAERDLSEQLVTGIFAAYVAGLAPALLGSAWASQHVGKRPMVRLSMVLMLAGSLLLYFGSESSVWLFAGRVFSGAGVGCIIGPGSAWVKELSAGHLLGVGARRATVALTSGFALGPVVAGVMAQWFPEPMHLPYLAHVAVQVAAAAVVWTAPELDTSDHPTPSVRAVVEHVREPWFLHLILPSAPWVFGAVTVAFAVIPSAVGSVPGLPVVVASGLTAGLTLGTSVLLQPSVRRFAQHDPGRTPPLGMVVVAVGMTIATGAALWPHPLWLVPAAMVLGGASGLLLVGSMTIVEHHTPAYLMAPTTAIVYVLTYIGFLAPYWVSVLSLVIPVWTVLAFGVVEALLTVAWLRYVRREA